MSTLPVTRLAVIGLPSLAAGAAVLGLVPDDTALAAAMTLPFLMLVPGLAWCSAIEDRLGWGSHAALVVAASLAFDAVVASPLALLHAWSPLRGYLILVIVTLIGLRAAATPAARTATPPPP